jgi:DNA-binding LytR/AlgR family response regulator
MISKLRIVIADDERPARTFLRNLLEAFEDVEVIAEAQSGVEALELIEKMKPDLALLDLQMPELTGLEVVKMLRKDNTPLIAFVTAYDEFAVQAFEVNAVDYLLKPVERGRLRETINRVSERLEQTDFRETERANLRTAIATYDEAISQKIIERIPVRVRDEIVLLPVREVIAIVADGELLNITTVRNERYTINFRLKDLEARLEAAKFVRLSRGALANIEFIQKISPMPGGTYLVTLKNNQQLPASRSQSRILREQLLRL